jgi:hypothetical protein
MVRTRDDFASFVEAALRDLAADGTSEWENATLERFLDALSAVSHGRLVDTEAAAQELPTWQLFAQLVAAATGYE